MLTRAQKEEQVAFLRERVARAGTVLAVDYRGLTVAQMTELRRKLRDAGEGQIEYRVAKNTLLRRAIAGTSLEGLGRFLEGPTAVAFAFEDASSAARVLVDYAKDNEKLGIKGGVVDGDVVDLAAIQSLAKLPGKQELRGMLAGTLQAPLRNAAGTLYALLGHLRNALEQRQQKLETP
jgi:large subunit ribosomal protein L10